MSLTSVTASTSRRTLCQFLCHERKSRSLSLARSRPRYKQSHESIAQPLQKCVRPTIQKCIDSSRSSSLVNIHEQPSASGFRAISVTKICSRSLSTSRNTETSRASNSESKWALKEWLPSVPRSIDISGMYRTLESLHVDFPKMLPDYRQILEQLKHSLSSRSSSLSMEESVKATGNLAPAPKDSADCMSQDVGESLSHSTLSPSNSVTSNLISQIESELKREDIKQNSQKADTSTKHQSIPLQVRLAAIRSKTGYSQRQAHDFSEAMSSMYESCESFNIHKDLTMAEKQSASKPADGAKYSSLRRVLVETAKMLNQPESLQSKETLVQDSAVLKNNNSLPQDSSERSLRNDMIDKPIGQSSFGGLVSSNEMLQSDNDMKLDSLKATAIPSIPFSENVSEILESNDHNGKSRQQQVVRSTLDDHCVYFSEKSATAADDVACKQTMAGVGGSSRFESDNPIRNDDGRRKLSVESLKSQALAVATSAYTSTSGLVRQVKDYIPAVDTTSLGSYFSGKNTNTNSASVKNSAVTSALEAKKSSSETQKGVVAVSAKKAAAPVMKRTVVSRAAVDRRTRALVLSLREARTPISQIARIEELSRHLTDYPESGGIAAKNKAIPCLLRLRSSTLTKNSQLSAAAREVLSLLGYADPVAGRGIRILSLDGGGTRGLIAIELMKKLEAAGRCPIHEMFDYICGVSTGALIAVMTGVFRVPLEETELLYKQFSSQMFARNRLLGAGKLFMSHAYYDTDIWERILHDNIGFKSFLETARDTRCPKISAVSAMINVHGAENFLFRNYGYSPAGPRSHYAGAVQHCLWQGIRASSAAPGYFEEFDLGNSMHQDGGLLTNNPTAIAIHESQLLWPGTNLQCVVSLGTGKYTPTSGATAIDPQPVSKSSLKSKVVKIVQSATDTEAVHTILHDLLKPSTYFRFNPYMSEDFQLDEIREEKWDQMTFDTEMYCRKNQLQIELAAQRLLQPKPLHRKASDWCKLRWNMIG